MFFFHNQKLLKFAKFPENLIWFWSGAQWIILKSYDSNNGIVKNIIPRKCCTTLKLVPYD